MRLVYVIASAAAFFVAELLYGPLGLNPWAVAEIRLPRALGAACSGSLMALAGLVLQTLLRNELADPYILGVPQLSVLGGTLVFVASVSLGHPYLGYVIGAVIGAAMGSALIVLIAARMGPMQVLIAGVLIGFAAYSAVEILLALIPPELVGYLVVGSSATFSGFDYAYAAAALTLLIIVVLVLAAIGRWISAIGFGEQTAAGFGVRVSATRMTAIAVSAASVGLVVVVAGPLAFLGLVAPFLARASSGSYRLDLAMWHAAAWGAAIALAADLAVRMLPVDVTVNAPLSLVGTLVAARILLRRYQQ